ADLQAGAHHGTGADRRSLPDEGVRRVGSGRRVTQGLEVGARRPWIAVVREGRPGAHHDAVLDDDALTDVHEGVELHPVADLHPARDVGLLPDDAVQPDACRTAHVHVAPDRSTRSDLDAGLDLRCGMYLRGHVDNVVLSTATQPARSSERYAASSAATAATASSAVVTSAWRPFRAAPKLATWARMARILSYPLPNLIQSGPAAGRYFAWCHPTLIVPREP